MSEYKLTIYADKSEAFGHFSVGVTGPGITEAKCRGGAISRCNTSRSQPSTQRDVWLQKR